MLDSKRWVHCACVFHGTTLRGEGRMLFDTRVISTRLHFLPRNYTSLLGATLSGNMKFPRNYTRLPCPTASSKNSTCMEQAVAIELICHEGDKFPRNYTLILQLAFPTCRRRFEIPKDPHQTLDDDFLLLKLIECSLSAQFSRNRNRTSKGELPNCFSLVQRPGC